MIDIDCPVKRHNDKTYKPYYRSKFLLVFSLLLLFLGAGAIHNVSAASLYWVGTDGASVGTASNWLTTNPTGCGGGDAGAAPGSTDTAIFDADCDNGAAIAANWTVQGINMNSGYTGTVTQNTTITLTVGSSGWTQASGTFTGSNAAIDLNDAAFNLTGGTFTNTSGGFTVERNFTVNGGTFTNTGNTVTFDDSSTADLTSVTCSETLTGTYVITKDIATTDAFTLGSGCTMPLGATPTTTQAANGTATNNGTLTVASGTWTMTGAAGASSTITNAGTITHSGNGWDFNGTSLTNNSGATITYSGTSITMTRNFTQNGTFDLTGITVTFDGSAAADDSTITCSGSLGGTVVFTKGANTADITVASGCSVGLGASPTSTLGRASDNSLVNNGTITIASGTWTVNADSANLGSYVIANNGTITHSGTGWDINDGNLSNNSGGTITYSGTAITMERSLTQNGTFDLTGITITFDGDNNADDNTLICGTNIQGNITINKTTASANTTLGGNCTVAGNFTRTDGPFTNPASAYSLTVQGNFSMSTTDTFAGANATLVMGGSGSQTITQNAGSIAGPFNVNKSGGTADIASGLNLSTGSTCNVIEGTFNINGRTFTCGSTFTVEDGGVLQLFGTSGESLTTPTLNSGSGVTYTGDGDGAADSITITTLAATYYDLTINSTDGTTDAFVLGAALDVNETLTLTAGVLNVSETNWGITVGGGWTDTGAGTFTEQSGTVTFDGTGTINSNETFNNVAINGSGITITVATNTLQVGGTLTVTLGTLNMNGLAATVTGAATVSGGTYTASTGTQTFNSTLTISGGTFTGSTGTVDLNNTLTISSGTFTAPDSSGTLTISGNFAFTGGTFTHNSGRLTFDASSGTQTLNGGGSSFNNITHSGAGTLQLTSNAITIGGTFTNSAGTYDANALATTVTGAATVSGGTYTASTATQTFDGGLTVSGGTYTGSSGTVDVNGAFTVSSGTFTAPGSSGTFTISGNFAHSGGTFTHNSGTVTLDGGNQTISDSSTFNNLTKTVTTAYTLTFVASTTQTIAATMTFKGASGALLSLRSDTAGTQFRIDPQGTRTIEYLDVRDSYNTNSTAITTSGFSITDSGNNTGWTFNTAPDAPSSLGSASLTNGSWTTDNSPTLTFTLADTDSGQTVLFRIQIDNNSDFSSLLVDYTSALQAQGATSFTVGQTAGSGSYTTGSSGQTLSDGSSYYWRVRAEDALAVTSDYATANAGSIAFRVDATAPSAVTLVSPDDKSYTVNERPTFRFRTAATPDATSGIDKYTATIDNGASGDFTIGDIPGSRTTNYETNKFLIKYEGFGDGDGSNNYISLYTKSSGSWTSGENDGRLKEGKRTWTITAYDNAGNQRSGSLVLYVDLTNPSLSGLTLPDEVDTIDSYHLLTTTLPHIKAVLADNLFPHQVEVSFTKENFLLGFKTGETVFLVETVGVNTQDTITSLTFNVQPSRSLDYGKYIVEVIGLDRAGHRSLPQEFLLHLLTDEKLKQLLALKNKKEETKIQQKEKAQTSFPYLEKKAKERRVKEAEELSKTISELKKMLAFFQKNFTFDSSIMKGSLFGTTFPNLPHYENLTDLMVGLIKSGAEKENQLALTIYQLDRDTVTLVNKTNLLSRSVVNQTQSLIVEDITQPTTQTLTHLSQQSLSLLKESRDALAYALPQALKRTGQILIVKPAAYFSQLVQAANLNLVDAQDSLIDRIAREEQSQIQAATGAISLLAKATEKSAFVLIKQAEKTSEALSKTIAQVNQDIKLGIEKTQTIPTRGIELTSRVLQGVKISVSTFYAYVLDPAPTSISDVVLEKVGRDYAVISWRTNHYTVNNKVNYGETLSYGKEARGENFTNFHQVKITGLKTNAHYVFEVMSQGKNYVYDAYYGLTTKK